MYTLKDANVVVPPTSHMEESTKNLSGSPVIGGLKYLRVGKNLDFIYNACEIHSLPGTHFHKCGQFGERKILPKVLH